MKPYIICHMMASLDGRIDCAMTEQIDDTNNYYDALNSLECNATLEGRVTLSMHDADAICFATPIYYYEMSGQMKTLLDRGNPLYTTDYKFRNIFMLTTAAEDEPHVPERAVAGLTGWIDCFEKAHLAGTVFVGGVNDPNEIEGNDKLKLAYELGKSIK